MLKHAIIVAGGSGTRMGAPMPKQYLLLNDQPVLMHTLRKFAHAEPEVKLILVIPENDFDLWSELCEKHNFQIPHHLVAGGKSRFQSVRNGLKAIEGEEGLVAIHDGVRPFVNASVINESYTVAASQGSAVAVIALKDSVRKLLDDGKSVYQERQYFRLVQTPQTFQLAKIKKAFEITELHTFTDDATVYEHQGWQVTLIAGNPENIKLTTPEDLDYAAFLLSR
ncbi:2-C-methyl-D-erythritol 4-phosphate cytidylyltransferase [Belliella sp. DSM 111904]|uniref:2-C-methyl-D-erythritol 4-phosphate cytidylyltransferase n=1 Tax=Belliella filtrata TaxID=2923435 RepID=A0ABS9UY92_9BACT|nr:2-C-methyl-D-erythritol 4-phosphate cytidylyltransferase [Belliella filtrata]MCH7409141.1 2-C-methyl-D-erythritol 4-phosphate cytidylyltransferase [Belliella filtrata]